jgi:Bacterial mobilisation protein (MobC)
MNEEKNNRKRGPKPLPAIALRTHSVNVRLNHDELALVKARRGSMRAGAWMRLAALEVAPTIIPDINKKMCSDLAHAAANLNQIAKKLNGGVHLDIDSIAAELARFRLALLGVDGAKT